VGSWHSLGSATRQRYKAAARLENSFLRIRVIVTRVRFDGKLRLQNWTKTHAREAAYCPCRRPSAQSVKRDKQPSRIISLDRVGSRNIFAPASLRLSTIRSRATASNVRLAKCEQDESTSSTSHLCRFPYLHRKLKQLAPLGLRDPLHSLVKPRRNVELDYRRHNILRNLLSFDNQQIATQMPELYGRK
jgi:hypothetical protein